MTIRSLILPILLATSTAGVTAPAMAAEVNIQTTNPVIELAVTERVDSAPDTATIGTGVSTKGATAQEALRLNSQAMDALIKRIKASGIAAKDIQTSGISISPDYKYEQDKEPQLVGYNASNQVTVRIRNIADLGKLIDNMVAAGANNLWGPNFSLDDDSAAKQTARESAMARAKAQAEFYAKQAGYTGVRLLSVSESVSGVSPYPVAPKGVARMAMADAAPVEPGQVGTSVTIIVQYEMTR